MYLSFYNGNHLETILAISHTLATYPIFIFLLCPDDWLDCRLPEGMLSYPVVLLISLSPQLGPAQRGPDLGPPLPKTEAP